MFGNIEMKEKHKINKDTVIYWNINKINNRATINTYNNNKIINNLTKHTKELKYENWMMLKKRSSERKKKGKEFSSY